MSEDVSSQTTPDDVEALTSLATDDAGDAEAAEADSSRTDAVHGLGVVSGPKREGPAGRMQGSSACIR